MTLVLELTSIRGVRNTTLLVRQQSPLKSMEPMLTGIKVILETLWLNAKGACIMTSSNHGCAEVWTIFGELRTSLLWVNVYECVSPISFALDYMCRVDKTNNHSEEILSFSLQRQLLSRLFISPRHHIHELGKGLWSAYFRIKLSIVELA